MQNFDEFMEVVRKIRKSCPWDKVQTHESLKPYLISETNELLEGIDRLKTQNDSENLCEELGDVLYQVMIQSQIASEQGLFTVEDVIDGLCEKMIRRHPHVFGAAVAATPEESLDLWNEIKKQEKAKKT